MNGHGRLGFQPLPEGRQRISWPLLKRVAAYARPHALLLVLILATVSTVSLLELLPPLLMRDLIDRALPNHDMARLNLLALGMIAVPLITGLLEVVHRYFTARAGEGIVAELRQQMYQHLQRMSLGFFTHTRPGEIVSRFNNDVPGAQNAVTGALPNVFVNLFTVVSTVTVMMTIEWRLGLVSLSVIPLFLLPARGVGRRMREIRRTGLTLSGQMSNMLTEAFSISGALLVKTFGRQKWELERFRVMVNQVRRNGIRQSLVGRWFRIGLGVAGALGTALMYWVGGRLVLEGAITVGTVVAFAAYLGRLYRPVRNLATIQVEFVSSLLSFERVFEYLDLPVDIANKEGALRLTTTHGLIEFKDVYFKYPTTPTRRSDPVISEMAPLPATPTREWALAGASFRIEPGQLVALVGTSGAGKSTITYLVARLYDPTQGAILLDGHHLRDLKQRSLMRHIGIVTQETHLFHDTVEANLRYGNLEATSAQLEAACRAAHVHEVIMRMPQGYQTMVGERGYRLSGGEKQRLSIARVILKNPQVLILDEATSHLDSQNETLIQQALEPLLAGRTSLVVAHRLSTILRADAILVFDAGRLVEQGTHRELLERNGFYARLYETQFAASNSAPRTTN
jgi:ATP-binding cassette subfamily B protein